MLQRLLALLLALPLASCGLFRFSRPVDVNHPTVTTPSGLEYEDVLTGLGEPAGQGDRVEIDYEGWLEDGTAFDSSYDRGIPVVFVLGQAPLRGWDLGVAGMRAGGRRRVHLPPEQAYGDAGVPGLVPPGAALVFEITLNAILSD